MCVPVRVFITCMWMPVEVKREHGILRAEITGSSGPLDRVLGTELGSTGRRG